MHAVPQVRIPAHGLGRVPSSVYRRRRLTAVLVLVVAVAGLAALFDTAAGGSAGRLIFERVVAVAVAVTWLRCAIALWRWNRSDEVSSGRSVAEPEVPCLASGSAPGTARRAA